MGILFSWFSTLRLQVNFKSKGKFRENCDGFPWSLARLVIRFYRGRGPGDFRGRARVWFAHLRHSLLRADRDSPAGNAQEWPTPLRQQCAFSSRCGAARPRDGVHPGRNTRAVLRVPARDASTETLAPTLPTKNRGTPGPDEAAQANGDVTQARRGLSLRCTRRVRRKTSSTRIKVKRARFPKEYGLRKVSRAAGLEAGNAKPARQRYVLLRICTIF